MYFECVIRKNTLFSSPFISVAPGNDGSVYGPFINNETNCKSSFLLFASQQVSQTNCKNTNILTFGYVMKERSPQKGIAHRKLQPNWAQSAVHNISVGAFKRLALDECRYAEIAVWLRNLRIGAGWRFRTTTRNLYISTKQ